MTKPTAMSAEQAAEALGIDIYDLAAQLRNAAIEALGDAADRVRRGYGLDVGKARRLMHAAEACDKAIMDVMEAEDEAERLASVSRKGVDRD